MEKIKICLEKVFTFTKSNLKKIFAVATIMAICGGSGAYYLHQQKVEKKILAVQAQTEITKNLAAEKNISLIDEEKIHELVAKNIGVEENLINYKEISLTDFDNRKPKSSKKDLRTPRPLDENQPVESMTKVENFQPIYKVLCEANDLRYKIHIDAVSGKILNIKVG